MIRIGWSWGLVSLMIIFCMARGRPAGAQTAQVTGIDEVSGKSHFGTQMNFPKFKSLGEFFHDFREIKKLTGQMEKNGYHLDPEFRETICLTVTLANNCGP